MTTMATLLMTVVCCLIACQASDKSTPINSTTTTDTTLSSARPTVTRYPLLVSKDAGKTWENASANLPIETEISFIEQKGAALILATDNKGIFISNETRDHWRRSGAELPNQKINALHIAGENLYVGVYRAGLFKSVDNGISWQSMNEGLPDLKVQAIHQMPDHVLVGTDMGLYFQKNGSQDWEATNLNAQVLSLFAHKGRVVAGTSLGTAISEDEGRSWTWIHQPGAIHYTHHIGERIIELMVNGDIHYSDDWGATWASMEYSPRYWSYVYEMVAVGDTWIMSNNYGVHQSTNRGTTWHLIYPTEQMGFFDFFVIDDQLYGGTRVWDEFRKR